MINKNHPFHLVEISPWPIIGSLRAIILIIGIIKWFHLININLLLIRFLVIVIVIYQWWRDIIRERTIQGLHTIIVLEGIKWGIILFIVSEILFLLDFLKIFS